MTLLPEAEPADAVTRRRRRFLSSALYLTAAWAIFRAVALRPVGQGGGDFTPIWTAARRFVTGQPLYDWDYSEPISHYLYSPAGTVVISPIGIFSSESVGRWVMLVLGAVCIVVALWLFARLVTTRYVAPLTAFLVIVAFLPEEPVLSTLILTNINGFLLLLMAIFCVAALHNYRHHPVHRWQDLLRINTHTLVAGVAVGVALAVKPQFIVLAGMAFLMGQWGVIVVAIVVFAALFGVGYALMSRPEDYFNRLLPFLAEPREGANGSIDGVGIHLGWGDATTTVVKILVALIIIFAVVALWRWRTIDPVVWVLATTAVTFAGVFLLSGLLQAYYSMWLLPLVATILRPRTPMLNVFTWIALLGILHVVQFSPRPDNILSDFFSTFATQAWVAFPLVIGIWAIVDRPRRTASNTVLSG